VRIFDTGETLAISLRIPWPASGSRFTEVADCFFVRREKLDNLKAAVTLYVAFYNFCSVHQLGITRSMGAGITYHVSSIPELIGAA